MSIMTNTLFHCFSCILINFFSIPILRTLVTTLFPYTTLFRSTDPGHVARHPLGAVVRRRAPEHRAQLPGQMGRDADRALRDRKSTRLNSSHLVNSYAVFCLKKKRI